MKLNELRRSDTKTPAPKVNLEGLFHALPHALIVVGDQNRILSVNFAAEVFFRVSETMRRLNLGPAHQPASGAGGAGPPDERRRERICGRSRNA